ncbi:hypothetical protein AVEN_229321-1 [Araneus ventricosus]|uniref:Tc1-like transposase DDE domain-containing protein n=1 Tax=Araneus ventricosus TaxID=182803 RepID=A0A4Y2PYT1_ARAVE|nr:hypothetical protein AVEN_271367-1 [Araneus ventricosus]GBN56043.1 hypothetical protein AVEN_229321-1 [Araneus ventricosus]
MLEIWLFHLIKEDLSNFVFQQDGAPPHWATEVRRFLNTELPCSWIGRSGPDDLMLHSWPPVVTPCDFFLCEFVKDQVYVPPLPTNLCELKQRISAAVQSITIVTIYILSWHYTCN